MDKTRLDNLTTRIRLGYIGDHPGPRADRDAKDFDEWLAQIRAEAAADAVHESTGKHDCPNCEGVGKINYGLVVGAKNCPICLGEKTLTRGDYLAAFGLFLQQNEGE